MADDPSYRLLGARSMLDRLQEVIKLTSGVKKSKKRSKVHQMRVATRRLRAAFQVFDDLLDTKGAKDWKKRIKRTTKALGAARDLDVQMEFLEWEIEQTDDKKVKPGIERLHLRLEQEREAVQPRVVKAMDRLETSSVVGDMGDYLREIVVEAGLKTGDGKSEYVYEQAYRHIAMGIENLLAYEPYVTRPECVEELHQMRIEAKRLRYSIELFEPVYDGRLKKPRKTFKKLQDGLGEIHDADVWGEFLPEFMKAEKQRTRVYYGHTRAFGRIRRGLEWVIEERAAFRQREYENFVAKWGLMKNEQFWDRLRETVRQPLVAYRAAARAESEKQAAAEAALAADAGRDPGLPSESNRDVVDSGDDAQAHFPRRPFVKGPEGMIDSDQQSDSNESAA